MAAILYVMTYRNRLSGKLTDSAGYCSGLSFTRRQGMNAPDLEPCADNIELEAARGGGVVDG